MSEQGRSLESSPYNWETSTGGMEGDYTLAAETEKLLDEFVEQEASLQSREEVREEGGEGASLNDFKVETVQQEVSFESRGIGAEDVFLDDLKVGVAVMPSYEDQETETSEKRPYGDVETASTSSEQPKKRRKKPKGLPKRALSSYNCFFRSERSKIQQEIPGIDFEELGRLVGKRWNELSEEKRQPYNRLAMEDRERYHNEMEAFKRLKEEEQKAACKKNEEEAERSRSLETESGSSPTPTTTHAVSASDNFPATQVPTGSTPSLPGGPSQVQGSASSWNIQQATHQSDPPVDAPQSSMKPSAFQPPGWQPSTFQPNAYSFLPGCVPVPPGLEIFLPDASGRERKYTVQYTWQSMTREAAEQFMESFMQPQRNMMGHFQGFNQHYMSPPQAPCTQNPGPSRHPPSMMQYQAPPHPPRGFHRY